MSRYTKRYTAQMGGDPVTFEGINHAAILRDLAIVVFIAMLLIAFWPLKQVPTGTRGVVTRGGQILNIQEEGFMLVWPWEKLDIFNVRAEPAHIDKAEGSTADQQPVTVSLTVRYNVLPTKVAEVFEKYTHTGDLSDYVSTASQEVFKAVTAKYKAPELISKRTEVSSEIMAGLQKKLDIYGARVVTIDMRNFAFSTQYMNAINEKVTQEQLAAAATNKLATVEATEKQKVIVAEAEAKATIAKAEAEARSLKIKSDALEKSKEVLELNRIEVELVKAQKWDGKLPQNIYAGAPIPFLQTK